MMSNRFTPAVVVTAVAVAATLGCSSEALNPLARSTSTSASGSGGAGGGSGGAGGQGAGQPTTCEPTADPPPPLKLTPIAVGLEQPVGLTAAPGDSSRLYVLERTGWVRVLKNNSILPEPFLDIRSQVACCTNDKGFLGLAFHPDYVDNGRFWIHYVLLGSPGNNSTVLAEYARSRTNPDVADPMPVKVLLQIDQDYVWHYGGTIAFGKDGYLYVSRGDGGDVGDPDNHAQDPMTKLGKMLRIDVDTHPTPPPGNMPDADPDVWQMGVRNPWRWSFDRCNGDLYFGDVGQNSYEEVTWAPNGKGHENFGWDFFEGKQCFEGACDPSGLTMPIVEYSHNAGCAVIGGYVYRGSKIPKLWGRYLYGDICAERIFSLVVRKGAAASEIDLSEDLESEKYLTDYGFSSFGEDADGELYVCDMAGTVFRIDPE